MNTEPEATSRGARHTRLREGSQNRPILPFSMYTWAWYKQKGQKNIEPSRQGPWNRNNMHSFRSCRMALPILRSRQPRPPISSTRWAGPRSLLPTDPHGQPERISPPLAFGIGGRAVRQDTRSVMGPGDWTKSLTEFHLQWHGSRL